MSEAELIKALAKIFIDFEADPVFEGLTPTFKDFQWWVVLKGIK